MATKCIQVHGDDGVGKRTLIGRLIFSCGEVGLPQVEQLERNGIRKYAQIASFYEDQPKMRVFYTPSSQFVFDESKKPDTLIWITDATASDGGRASSQKLASSVRAQTPESLVILVNKMDLVNWSSSTFGEMARNFSAVGPISKRTSIIPISLTQGDNIVETPAEHPWVQSITPTQFTGCDYVSAKPLMDLLE